MNINKLKLIVSSSYATIISIAFVVVITIWAEFSIPLKDWLKNFSGHHWTSKSIFSVLLYIIATAIFYFSLPNPSENRPKKALIFVLLSVILGAIILTLFFTAHHFKIF